jgi:hypothetical protein
MKAKTFSYLKVVKKEEKEGSVDEKEENEGEEENSEEGDREERNKDEEGEKEESNNEEEGDETDGFWKKWIEFLKNNEKFHPYRFKDFLFHFKKGHTDAILLFFCSPENHNIIRCGKGVSHRPNLDPSIYMAHLDSHEENKFGIPDAYIPFLNGIFSSVS